MRQPIKPTTRKLAVSALSAAAFAVGASLLLQTPGDVRAAAPGGRGAGRANIPPPPDAPAAAAEPVKPGDPLVPPMRNPAGLMERTAETGAQVYVDDSFASVEKLRDAIRQANQQQSSLAIETFQGIVDNYGQKLVYLGENSYVSITDYVRERLLQMPAVKQGMYDQLFGSRAKTEIDSAIARHDISTLIRMSDRYFPSAAALHGLSQAAEWYFERGEFSAAARTWRELFTHPLAGNMQADLLFRAATAEGLAQRGGEAKTLRDRLAKDFPDATGLVQGKEVKLLPRLDELLTMPPWEKVNLDGDEWPAFGGGPSRSNLLNVNATIGAQLWSLTMPSDAPSQTAGQVMGSTSIMVAGAQARALQISSSRTLVPPARGTTSHPVLSNGQLFVHMGDRLMSVSANAGTQLWTYPEKEADVIPRINGNIANNLRNASGVNVLLSAHDSAAVFGDQVFAVLPAQETPASAGASRSPYGAVLGNSRLVCLDRDTGHEIWSRPSDDVKLEKGGSLIFTGSPIVTRQSVFVTARKMSDASFVQQYIVRLDRDTGAVTWNCYVCSTSTGSNNYPLSGLANTVLPTLVDDVLYICTGQGADCAVDANAGRILWLRVATEGSNGPNMPPSAPVSWKFNPPVITGDKMIVADSPQVLQIYNRWTGAVINTIKTAELGAHLPSSGGSRFSVDVLAGVSGSHLVLSGAGRTMSLDVNTLDSGVPEPQWVSGDPKEGGKPAGRPFLTATSYYVPFEQRLTRIDLEKGTAEAWEWPPTESGTPSKPGNILVTSEQVVVVSDNEIAGFSKWETARDNRLAQIKAHPQDPLAYLALAEVSFRTNHADIAQDNMKKSVDLANKAAAANSQTMADVLGRLYSINLNFAEQLLQKTDPTTRDQARFYFEQCRASAREPVQQAQWRLRMAELSLKQKKADEAAMLYSDVMTDPALRTVGYEESDVQQSAGATAEQGMGRLIAAYPGVYQRFEDRAAAAVQAAAANKDFAALQRVIDGYPNSAASITAATTLAAAYQNKGEWDNARRALWWLQSRVTGDALAQAIANLVQVNLQLKRYASATGWAERGLRNFKDAPVTLENGEKLKFADFRQKIASAGGAAVEGRLPAWHGDARGKPQLEIPPLNDESNVLGRNSRLLVPIETSPALRPPNLVFLQNGEDLRIYDSAKGADRPGKIQLPSAAQAILLGVMRDVAVILQNNQFLGVDLNTQKIWRLPLPALAGGPALPQPNAQQQIINLNGQRIVVNGGVVQINGVVVQAVQGGQIIIDQNGLPINAALLSDPEVLRKNAFIIPDKPAPNFTTARLVNGNLVVLRRNQLEAYDVQTGKPAWNLPSAGALPNVGNATSFIGNEDVLVAQIDSPDGTTSTFCVVDADTGKIRKQIKLNNERANWRALGDDDTLFVVTDQSVIAFDTLGESTGHLWQKGDFQTRFAGASALTLDGLIVVDNNADVMCLSLETGTPRWPRDPKVPIRLARLSGTAVTALRSVVDGDLIIFQSDSGLEAYRTTADAPDRKYPPNMGPQFEWSATAPGINEPLVHQAFQLSNLHIVEMDRSSASMSKIVFYAREGGKIQLPVNITRNAATPDAINLRAWQLVDDAVAFDVEGVIYLWRNKTP